MRANASSVSTCAERGAHGRERQRVARERAADAADVGVLVVGVGVDLRPRARASTPYAALGMPAPSVLPIVTKSGCRSHAIVQPPGPALIVWVSSMISSVPYLVHSSRTASW